MHDRIAASNPRGPLPIPITAAVALAATAALLYSIADLVLACVESCADRTWETYVALVIAVVASGIAVFLLGSAISQYEARLPTGRRARRLCAVVVVLLILWPFVAIPSLRPWTPSVADASDRTTSTQIVSPLG